MQKGQMSWSKSATSCLVTPMHPKKPPITLVALDHQPALIRTTAETMLSRPAAGMLWHSLRTSCLRTSQGTTKSRSLLPRLSPEDFVVIQEKQVPVDVKILYYIGLARNNSPSSGASSPSSQAKRKTKSAFRGWHRPSSSGCSQLNLVPPQWPPDPNPARTRTRRIMIPVK